uniref:Uncharacterized protein n=1 Tax=Sciurus vulgaris TaxID=55149 RepID=A0A8D2ADK6_SCIVU
MAVSRGVGTHILVLLLCCWQEVELQLTNMTSGSVPSRLGLNPADDILVQELLEPNKSKFSETHTTAATLSTKQSKEKNAGIDENYQADGAENYHELLESTHFSSGNEDRTQLSHLSSLGGEDREPEHLPGAPGVRRSLPPTGEAAGSKPCAEAQRRSPTPMGKWVSLP